MTAPVELVPAEYAKLVGTAVGISDWIEIGQERIDRFADATDDHQFIHVDPAAAALIPLRGTVAHGFLTVSLLSAMAASLDGPRLAGVRMAINYGCDRLRFISPVPSGARIRGHFTLAEFVEIPPGQWQQKSEVVVEIEGREKPALAATWITRLFT